MSRTLAQPTMTPEEEAQWEEEMRHAQPVDREAVDRYLAWQKPDDREETHEK